jgi:hypothetical protein
MYSRALSLAKEKDPPLQLIPVILREAELPGFLANRNWVDFRDESAFDENLEKLIWGITGKKPSDSSSRPFDKQTTKQHPGNAVPIQVEENSDDFALFCSSNGQSYFIPIQDGRWDSAGISLKLVPETTEQSAFLNSLRNNLRTTLAVALQYGVQYDAAWVSPREVTQTMSGAQTVWTVVLQKDNRSRVFSLDGEATFENISADKIAEMRAKRILLNEELEFYKDSQNLVDRLNKATLEVYVRGLDSPLQPLASPIPLLYQLFGSTPERFRKFARLVSVLYLKLSNTVEHILQLDLDFIDEKNLKVTFRGRRRRGAVNVEPSIIEVNGICSL